MQLALIEKAGKDEGFRSRLRADPKATIQNEFSVSVPDGFSLNFDEQSANAVHMILPPSPHLSTVQLMAAVRTTGSSSIRIQTTTMSAPTTESIRHRDRRGRVAHAWTRCAAPSNQQFITVHQR